MTAIYVTSPALSAGVLIAEGTFQVGPALVAPLAPAIIDTATFEGGFRTGPSFLLGD